MVCKLIFCILLLVASYTDIKSREIPNWICISVGALALMNFHYLGSLVALPFLVVAVKQPNSMGGGDIKLIGTVGMYMGVMNTMLGLIVGLTLSIIYALANKSADKGIPLAPFLAFGFILMELKGV